MEHKTINGGEIYLPFARSRIKALRATGLQHASQQFEIDGASIKVRIAGAHEYISLGGGDTYVFVTKTTPRSFTLKESLAEPWGDVGAAPAPGLTVNEATKECWLYRTNGASATGGAQVVYHGVTKNTVTTAYAYENVTDGIGGNPIRTLYTDVCEHTVGGGCVNGFLVHNGRVLLWQDIATEESTYWDLFGTSITLSMDVKKTRKVKLFTPSGKEKIYTGEYRRRIVYGYPAMIEDFLINTGSAIDYAPTFLDGQVRFPLRDYASGSITRMIMGFDTFAPVVDAAWVAPVTTFVPGTEYSRLQYGQHTQGKNFLASRAMSEPLDISGAVTQPTFIARYTRKYVLRNTTTLAYATLLDENNVVGSDSVPRQGLLLKPFGAGAAKFIDLTKLPTFGAQFNALFPSGVVWGISTAYPGALDWGWQFLNPGNEHIAFFAPTTGPTGDAYGYGPGSLPGGGSYPFNYGYGYVTALLMKDIGKI